MLKDDTKKDYQERINKVLIHINNHLGENLDVDKLAEISNFSLFHFHRILKAHLNESLGAYILRIRLETGARLLEFSKASISDIANKVGYETSSAFIKAFKRRFTISPLEYRNELNKSIQFDIVKPIKKELKMKLKPKIKKLKPVKVIFIQSIEQYGGEKMQTSWITLMDFVKKHKLFSFGMGMYGVSHDDPNITEPEKCRYDACVSIKKEVKPEGEIGVKEIEGGKYAIFLHKGPYNDLGDAYNMIYGNWLPSSEFSLREAPCFDKYLNNPDKTKPENLKTEIYVPVN